MGQLLSAQPGMVEGTGAAVFGQDQTVSRIVRTFTRQYRCAQTDSKAIGLNLNMTFHQNDLEGPALKPSKSEGICHGFPFRQRAHPMALA